MEYDLSDVELKRVNFVNDNNVELIIPDKFIDIKGGNYIWHHLYFQNERDYNLKFRSTINDIIHSELINNEKNIIDAGAFIGMHSLPWSKVISGHVYSIEPSPNNIKLMNEISEINGIKNLTIFPYALSNKIKMLSYDGSLDNTYFYGDDTGSDKIICTSLNALHNNKNIDNVELINLNVEGEEYNVLLGGSIIIKKYKPIISIHINTKNDDHFIKVKNILNDYEYILFELNKLNANADDKNAYIIAVPTGKYHLFLNNKCYNNLTKIERKSPENSLYRNMTQQEYDAFEEKGKLDKLKWIEFCEENTKYIRLMPFPYEVDNKSTINAVFIEFRPLPNIEFVIVNCLLKLKNKCRYTIVCGNDNYHYISALNNKYRQIFQIINLNCGNISISDYNVLLETTEFWEKLEGEHILLYQHDSCVFKNNVEDFLEYDYIGAPWGHFPAVNTFNVGNGGFSLRNKKKMIEIIKKNYSSHELIISDGIFNFLNYNNLNVIPEDVFFTNSMIYYKLGKVPHVSVAKKFSQETILSDTSFGGHCWWLCNTLKMKIDEFLDRTFIKIFNCVGLVCPYNFIMDDNKYLFDILRYFISEKYIIVFFERGNLKNVKDLLNKNLKTDEMQYIKFMHHEYLLNDHFLYNIEKDMPYFINVNNYGIPEYKGVGKHNIYYCRNFIDCNEDKSKFFYKNWSDIKIRNIVNSYKLKIVNTKIVKTHLIEHYEKFNINNFEDDNICVIVNEKDDDMNEPDLNFCDFLINSEKTSLVPVKHADKYLRFKPMYSKYIDKLTHRGGWKFIIKGLEDSSFFSEDGDYTFFDQLEPYFLWNYDEGEYEYTSKKWCGIIHCTPYAPPHLQDIDIDLMFKNEHFKESLNKCFLLITLCCYTENYVKTKLLELNILHINVVSIKHPVIIDGVPKFTMLKYNENTEPQLIQLGQQLRIVTSIYQLKLDNEKYKKLWLTGTPDFYWCEKRVIHEMDNLCIGINEEEMSSVTMHYTKDFDEYDYLLGKNVVFMNLFDSAANNAVVECIIRNTPMIINKTPGVLEYLGEDYPLYFTNLYEVESLLTKEKINEAHEYLKNMDKTDLTFDHFYKSLIKEIEDAIFGDKLTEP
jgi:FkbM family methyltransferase